jgi:hypothetical protein
VDHRFFLLLCAFCQPYSHPHVPPLEHSILQGISLSLHHNILLNVYLSPLRMDEPMHTGVGWRQGGHSLNLKKPQTLKPTHYTIRVDGRPICTDAHSWCRHTGSCRVTLRPIENEESRRQPGSEAPGLVSYRRRREALSLPGLCGRSVVGDLLVEGKVLACRPCTQRERKTAVRSHSQ